MRKIGSFNIFFPENSGIVLFNILKNGLICSIVVSFLAIFVLSIGKNFLLTISLNNEILQIRTELNSKTSQFELLRSKYNFTAEQYLEKQKIARVIRSINPILIDDNVNMWVRMIRQNKKLIVPHLNKSSLRKLDIKGNKYSLGTGISLLMAVAALESDFKVNARSTKGAYGPMQINRITAIHIGLLNRKDPEDNINAGALYLVELLNKYKEYPDQLELVLASYNAGKTRVYSTWMPQWGNGWLGIKSGLGRRFKETRNYVNAALAMTQLFKSGEWSSKTDRYWSNYKYYARSTDLGGLYTAVIIEEENPK